MLILNGEMPPINPLINTLIEIQTPQVVEPEPVYEITWRDNPQGCDEATQWIAAEEPFYCINKPIRVNTPLNNQNTLKTARNSPQARSGGYTYGYCTEHVYNTLSWVPSGLGNAVTWRDRLIARGHTVSSEPIVGAVAWQGSWVARGYGHVATVIAVNGEQVTVSEKNFTGWNRVSTRTVHKSTFSYIYP